jgi:predicted regulator of Ras-like GTPase activity (Roadblock/LC7/MglB family)
MPAKVNFPLQPIINGMPDRLKAFVKCKPNDMVCLDSLPILNQLSSGMVKVFFAELRNNAPAGCFPDNPQLDNELVEIPLNEAMARVGSYLPKRRPRKRLEVPDNISNAFAIPKTSRAAKTSEEATREPLEASVSEPIESVPRIAPPDPTPSVIPFPKPPPTPPPAAPKPAPAPAAIPFDAGRIAPPAPPKPAPAAPKPVAMPPASAPAMAKASESVGLVVSLSDVCAGWPEAILQEVEAGQLRNASLSLPTDRLENALKAGRIVFTWGELSQWLQPPWSADLTNAATELELPLDRIAPLFMAQKRGTQGRRKVALNQSIPDVFITPTKAPAPAPPVAPAPAPKAPAMPAPAPTPAPVPAAPRATPAPAAVAAPVAVPAPKPAVDPDLAIVNEILAMLKSDEKTLQDLAKQVVRLKGVAGVIIATGDGFSVASEMPPHFVAGMEPSVQGEVLAALFPQLFSKLNEYFLDLELGKTENLKFTVGNSTIGVYRAGELYFAAVAHAGGKLPEASLEPIVAAVGRRPA